MQSAAHDPGISLTQIGAMLAARKVLVLAVAFLTVAAAAVATLLMTKTYVSRAEVFIEYRGSDPILGRQFSAMQDDSYLSTQIDILKSDDVVRYIVDQTRALDMPDTRKQVEAKGLDVVKPYLMKAISDDLVVVPRRNSRVLELQFHSRYPEFARDALNAAIKGYMEITAKIHTEPAKARQEQYSTQLLALQADVDRIQGEITAYQQRENILDADERLDSTSRQFGELNSRLLAVQASLSEASTRKRSIQNLLTQGGAAADIPEIARLEGVRDVRLRLIEVEGRLAETSGVLGPNHPKFKSLQADRDTLRAQLDRASSSALQAIEQEERRFAEQARTLQREISVRQQQLLETKKHRDVIVSLQRQLASAQQIYNGAVARYDEILIQSNVNTPTIAVLQWAEKPVKHSKPSLTRNVMVSVPGGIVLGLLLALFLELGYRRVRCTEDLEASLPVPVLGVA